MAAFHSLSILDAVSQSSPKSTLAVLKEWEPVRQLHSIRGDIVKGSVAMFMSEIIYRSLTNEQADPQLFGWLCDMVAALEDSEGSIANFPLWFLVSYAVKMGFMPGETIEPPGLFSPDEATLFQRILRLQFGEAMDIPLSASRRQAFLRKMLQYLSHHLGATIDSKSLDVLHAVLA